MTPLTLTADRTGERVDSFLSRLLPDLTRSAAQRLLEEGLVTRCGVPVKKSDKTVPGDTFTVALPDPAPMDVFPQNIPLDVVYEDADIIVVNKPVGMVVHPAAGHPTELWSTRCYITAKNRSPESTEPSVPALYTVDRDTSGLLVAAKNDFSPPRSGGAASGSQLVPGI